MCLAFVVGCPYGTIADDRWWFRINCLDSSLGKLYMKRNSLHAFLKIYFLINSETPVVPGLYFLNHRFSCITASYNSGKKGTISSPQRYVCHTSDWHSLHAGLTDWLHGFVLLVELCCQQRFFSPRRAFQRTCRMGPAVRERGISPVWAWQAILLPELARGESVPFVCCLRSPVEESVCYLLENCWITESRSGRACLVFT